MAVDRKIYLKPGKDAALRRFHPWIFSGAIEQTSGGPREGDVVAVYDAGRELLAFGHYLTGSIAVKVFSFGPDEPGEGFWLERIRAAYNLRQSLGLTGNASTNAYRLVFTEGDLLPGLIMDYYNGTVVIQTHSLGMHHLKPMFVSALKEIYRSDLKAVYDKSSETMKARIKGPSAGTFPLIADQYLYGSPGAGEILETGHRFAVDWEKGQKTGFFLDQRGNRMFAQFYAKNRKVLNAFCYSGAFSVYALKGGAVMVHSVDSSEKAMGWTEENIRLNGISTGRHRSFTAELKDFMTHTDEKYDMIVLDPPAFAKTHTVTNNALRAYTYLNAAALRRLNRGGILFTFSCSQAITRQVFTSAVTSAAIESRRKVRILHHLSQGPDHPVSLFHPESEYLKGLILAVD